MARWPMSHRIWYVIPTYWTGDEAGAFSSIYDHPTPIGSGESTLPRLLASVEKAFETMPAARASILILISTVDEANATEAETWVRKICAPFRHSLQLFFAGEDVVRELVAADGGFASGESLFRNGYRGYGDVRNLELILPALFGARWIFGLDDDEVISVETVERVLWHMTNGTPQAVAGIYLNEDGSFLVNASSAQKDVGNVLADKGVFMNMTYLRMKEANEHGRLPLAPMALGGNMLIPKGVFWKVGFDPYVPRGEDVDYVVNAKAVDQHFCFDFELAITHLPPRHLEADEYGKMKADVIRFVYERAKVNWFRLATGDFYDYPGRLFEEGFEADALEALRALATLEREDAFGSPEEILTQAKKVAAEHLGKYVAFAKDWEGRLEAWHEDEPLLLRIWQKIG